MNFEEDLQDRVQPAPAPEREISLGTSTILGIFLGLALICAAFFGFGYSMGHKASLPPVAAEPAAKSDSTFSNFKAAPVAAKTTSPVPAPTETAADTPAADPADTPKTSPAAPAATAATAAAAAADAAAGDHPPASSDGAWVVQVSVSSVKPDAEKLTGVLTRQGFPATMQTSKDGKFHIRVGPFSNKATADTTRKMLVADGYKEPYISNH